MLDQLYYFQKYIDSDPFHVLLTFYIYPGRLCHIA